jgi:hypothetical protein
MMHLRPENSTPIQDNGLQAQPITDTEGIQNFQEYDVEGDEGFNPLWTT